MPKVKRLAQINDLVNGLSRVASGLRQKSEACHPLSSTSLQSKLKRKAIDDAIEPPAKKRTLAQRDGLPSRKVCIFSNVFGNFSITLIKLCILNILPYELFCEIGFFIDIEELKTVILVCKLFCNIYLPIYLSRYKFSSGQRNFWLHEVQDFTGFRSYHRSQNLPVRARLSAFFNEIYPNIQVESLAYALDRLPSKTFASISLFFPRYSCAGPQAVSKLLTALISMQCSELSVSACLEDLHSNTSIASIFTPLAFHLTDLKLDGDLSTAFFQPLLCCTAPSLEVLTLDSFNGDPNHIFPVEGWKALLGSGEFPQLRRLKVSNDIPLSLLLKFLSCHSGIRDLAIEVNAEDSGLMHDTTHTFSTGSLSAVSGSPQYILALLRRASRPPSLSRLSLYASHLPKSSIVADTFKCLALCQKVDALELSLPHSNCQTALHAVHELPQLDIETLGIKKFKIMFLEFTHFSSDNTKTVSNGDIVVSTLLFRLHAILKQSQSAWREWHKYLGSVKHFELDEIFSTHDRREVCKVLSNEFPGLAVSVHGNFSDGKPIGKGFGWL